MDQAEKRGIWLLVLTVAVIAFAGWWFFLRKPVIIRQHPQPPAETVGVGLYLGRNQKTHKFEVRRVFPDSPAAQAGITPGLILNKVGEVDAESRNIKDLSKLLTGPVGSTVHLEMLDTNGTATELDIVRQKFLNRSTNK